MLKNEFSIAVEEYLEDASSYIKEIRLGLDAGDAKKISAGSHPLKSNSKSFGLIDVSFYAEAINALSRQGKLEGVKKHFIDLQEAFTNAEKVLRDLLKQKEY